MSFPHLVTHTISHKQAICSLYKRALRNLESWYRDRPNYRFHACLLRRDFDKNRDITDFRKAKELLDAGERELWLKQHYLPKKFPNSPGGVASERYIQPPDWVLDYWHPLEKAQYPKYFATREKRKLEYIEMYEKYLKQSKLESGKGH
ncbi:NADH dehydrogenase [ubiquinone] 1 beta subcomplex subunit 9-like [Varroa jacobsoni]|uniref:NADH dehydrogenase [ubiquinone] 1 beta subcomplex subunit 9-like n=1 Tax=Varroa jacobsoni TaxID=62625 RepID=UPI000BF6335C|nr:NADH dehydrogenase [ubiquinone] 1 beta subcomplex subunit 9-like [Varroa jacobsoni]